MWAWDCEATSDPDESHIAAGATHDGLCSLPQSGRRNAPVRYADVVRAQLERKAFFVSNRPVARARNVLGVSTDMASVC
jgi:hypothetical protein